MKTAQLLAHLRHKLIVSCQAEAGFPLNTPEHLTALAQTAVRGGASAIRASEPANIRAMKAVLDVPIIGIYKKDYPGFDVRITPTLAEVAAVVEAGSDIIALDATHRPRPNGQTFAELYHEIRAHFDVPIMADIATFAEGIAAAELGVDIVATTLSGYAGGAALPGPDIPLVRQLAAVIDTPIIAEGRIGSPEDVRAALDAGAHAVVVGSMITRPHLITEHFMTGLSAPVPVSPVLALDIGGTKIAGGVIDAQGTILVADQVPNPGGDGQTIVALSLELLGDLKGRIAGEAPVAIGIGTGGQIDARGEIIGSTGMLRNWIGQPLRQQVADHFGLPTAVLNDGHAATLAESRIGAGRGRPSVFCAVIGTGLGGGLAIDGRVQHGSHGLTGSLGQLKVSPDGQTFMPLEDLVSGPGLARQYERLAGLSPQAFTGQEVAHRAQAGEALAQEVVTDMGAWLGLGLSHALHAYDATCVVVGGSVAQIGDLLFDAVRRSLRRHGHATVAETPILPATLGPQAGLIGAAIFAQQQCD